MPTVEHSLLLPQENSTDYNKLVKDLNHEGLKPREEVKLKDINAAWLKTQWHKPTKDFFIFNTEC